MLIQRALQTQSFVASLRDSGRGQAVGVLEPEVAQRLALAAAQAAFSLSVNSGPKSMDLSLAELATLTQPQHDQMTALIHAGARSGFQYCFDSYRLSDAIEQGELQQGPLYDFYRSLNSAPVLDLFRQIAGDAAIDFCDAQVTRYRPGHFLTQHDDAVDGKGRVMAFVLNLTPQWRADWGGLLLFHGSDGHVEGGYTPGFNCLNLFKVPKLHAVSQVAAFAGAARLSITGWVRRRA
ncbi:2OG-Fe(II) oxygenase [Roseateles sp. DAIF2]|uniref:2OG-Fe(II) oxygenase n=1 Tax=Roseateles sp. DAIF2 TaxID=2714952 RepID=UPI0018A2A569|nr:2OG-Fe(II) oxygenase family protein [Roseateles sp. DAIF2]QPF76001.1 2OG-Fe(II) oxygenase [Roseateles sp. DAIF2]